MELHGCLIVVPARIRANKNDSRFVTVFCLSTDISHRLVQQDSHALCLLRGGLAFNGDTLMRQDLAAEFRHDHAIDPYPATFYPFIGFAA